MINEEHRKLHHSTIPTKPPSKPKSKHVHKKKTNSEKENIPTDLSVLPDDEEKPADKQLPVKKEDKLTKGIDKLKAKIKKNKQTRTAIKANKTRPITAPEKKTLNKVIDLSSEDDEDEMEDIDSPLYRIELHDRLVYNYIIIYL